MSDRHDEIIKEALGELHGNSIDGARYAASRREALPRSVEPIRVESVPTETPTCPYFECEACGTRVPWAASQTIREVTCQKCKASPFMRGPLPADHPVEKVEAMDELRWPNGAPMSQGNVNGLLARIAVLQSTLREREDDLRAIEAAVYEAHDLMTEWTANLPEMIRLQRAQLRAEVEELRREKG